MKKIALIGSTGSIGRQVLNVVRRHKEQFRVTGLVCFSDGETLLKQVEEFAPERYALASENAEDALSIAECADADLIFNAAGGFAGLEYSVRALKAGKNLALANKETLVCGGDYVTALADSKGAEIIPVDSEHSAIWQCLGFDRRAPFKRLIITASGGAFRGLDYARLKDVTPAQALNHPTWKMGAKITVDSATMMNKGYEVIEAHHLYSVGYNRIATVIQPQSIVHSLVEFDDGALLAQMSYPTMEVPIQLALTYPERLGGAVTPMDFNSAFSLGFEPLSRGKYPCFDLALDCAAEGGVLPCAMNAADEEAVKAFLQGKIAFTDVYRVAEGVLSAFGYAPADGLEVLKQTDRAARRRALEIIKRLQ